MSTATVSRVINGLDVVSPDTVARVRRAMEELSYRPNRTARALITRRNMVLGLSVPALDSEFYALVIAGAERAARLRGYHLLVTSHLPVDEIATMNFSADLLDGAMIVVTEQVRRERFLSSFDDSVPVVVLGHLDLAEAADVTTVAFDNRTGAAEATRHLLERTPPESCYFVGAGRMNPDTRRRASAFERVLKETGHELRPDQFALGSYSIEHGRAWATDMHRRGRLKGAAVLSANDEIALGILHVASEVGLCIPGDLRVVGFDDSAICRIVQPNLSSVRTPREELGARGAEVLMELIASPDSDAKRYETLPTELVRRCSS